MGTAPHGFLRVGAACPPVAIGDPDRNAEHVLAFLGEARAQGVQAVVLPELCLTGYTAGALFFSLDTIVGGAERALATLLHKTRSWPMVVVVGLPALSDGRLYNVAAVFQSGVLLGVVPKSYLPSYREYYEKRWFNSARERTADSLRLAGHEVPFAPELLFEVPGEPGVTLAVEICEDLWAPTPPSSLHAVAGATVILCPSASNELAMKAEYRRELVKVQSARGVCAYAYANCGGHESTTDVVYGGQLLLAENGTLLAEGRRFARPGELVVTDVDTGRLQVERARQTSFS